MSATAGGATTSAATCCGIEDAELYARWVQFGVFSPILRLHSTNNPLHDRRPWGFDAEVERVARAAMQLRHALIPYLYTQSWRNERETVAPIRPMYHDYPDEEAAYHCPQQYYFGSDLIVAPFVERDGSHHRLSRQVVWLPAGDWFDFFDGEHYRGGGWHAVYGDLRRVPVFARAGAIIPLGQRIPWGGVDAPALLDLHLFAGADGDFALFEDDGETVRYRSGDYALTAMPAADDGAGAAAGNRPGGGGAAPYSRRSRLPADLPRRGGARRLAADR